MINKTALSGGFIYPTRTYLAPGLFRPRGLSDKKLSWRPLAYELRTYFTANRVFVPVFA